MLKMFFFNFSSVLSIESYPTNKNCYLSIKSLNNTLYEYPTWRALAVSTIDNDLSCGLTMSGSKPLASDRQPLIHRMKQMLLFSDDSDNDFSISMLDARKTEEQVRIRRICEYSPWASVWNFCGIEKEISP